MKRAHHQRRHPAKSTSNPYSHDSENRRNHHENARKTYGNPRQPISEYYAHPNPPLYYISEVPHESRPAPWYSKTRSSRVYNENNRTRYRSPYEDPRHLDDRRFINATEDYTYDGLEYYPEETYPFSPRFSSEAASWEEDLDLDDAYEYHVSEEDDDESHHSLENGYESRRMFSERDDEYSGSPRVVSSHEQGRRNSQQQHNHPQRRQDLDSYSSGEGDYENRDTPRYRNTRPARGRYR